MLQTILCKYCQGSIKDSDRFCYYCGKLVNDGTQTSDITQTPNALPSADMGTPAPIPEPMPPLATVAGSETVSDSSTAPLDRVPITAIPLSASPQPQTASAKTDMPPAQSGPPVFDSFQLQAAPSSEQIPPVEPADSSVPSSVVSVAPKASEPPPQAASALSDHAPTTATPEPQNHTAETNQATKPEAGISAPNAALPQPQTDTFCQKTKPSPKIVPTPGISLQNKPKDKSKTAKPTKTVTRLKADPLAKTRIQAKTKTKASKAQAEKIRLPFYFLLPHMCTLFSILMLLLTAVSFFGFSSSMGVFFLFPCWPLGLLLFAALMFFTPLRGYQAPRGVNFFIKLNLVYNIIMLALSGTIMFNGDQHITVWLFVWFAGGFILPLSILFLNRRLIHYIH